MLMTWRPGVHGPWVGSDGGWTRYGKEVIVTSMASAPTQPRFVVSSLDQYLAVVERGIQ